MRRDVCRSRKCVTTVAHTIILFLFFITSLVFAQSFSFAVTSDQRSFAGPGEYDTSSYYRGAIEALASVGAGDFMVVVGDMDPIASTEYTINAVLGDYLWYPVVGNHELPGQGVEDYYGGNMDYVRAMNVNGNSLPNIVNVGPPGCIETSYSFDHGYAHIVVLNVYYNGSSDVGTDGDVVDALYNWLAADLAATTQPHIFIFGHEPAFPQPDVDTGRIRHEFDSLNQYPDNRDRFWQLMVDEGVLAYVCGHTHNYSLYNFNGVWHVESGHTYGLGDPEVPSTFMKFMVDADEVFYATYRDDSNGGPYTLRYAGSLTSPEVEVPLVSAGSVWSYLDDGSNQGAAWREPGFDDNGWASGAAQLGYGDGDETTVIGYGPDPNNKYVTTYFRHTFNVPDASVYNSLNLRVLRDDGAVVYLNGVEIFRTNLPDGTIDYLTSAGYAVGDPEEDQFFGAVLDPSLLVNGANVLAVELHQANATSSDLSFDLSLSGMSGGTPMTSVYGQLYLDYNQNNVRDGDDEGLANIDVVITDGSGSQTVITNANGDWSALVAPGSVTIDIDQSDPDFPADATQTQGNDPTTIIVSEGDNTFAGADGFYIQISEMILIPAGSVWSYLDDGSDQGTAWRSPSFNDGSWATGPAQLGYGDGDEATVVSYGRDPKKKYITTYFRHSFDVPDASAVTKLNLGLLRDDGAIVYLNGVEVFRSNMPVDPIDYKTTASAAVDGSDENTFFTKTVAPNVLTTGTNVIAVEIHQFFKMDEDVSFDLQLIAQQSGEPVSYATGHLYLDANGNGAQDSGESGLANINVLVTDSEQAQTVMTDTNGDWTAMVAAGTITVDVLQSDADFPAGATQTEGDDPTSIFAVEGEVTFAGNDGFYVSLGGTIGDYVWNDANFNGLQDQGESGVEGMSVTLFNASGQVGAPVSTDQSGHYSFTALDPGSYYVVFANLPAQAVFTIQDVNSNGSDVADSDVNAAGQTASFELSTDQIKTDIDAGIYIEAPPEPAQAQGVIWGDLNADGLYLRPEKYVGFVTVNLLSSDGGTVIASTEADRKGLYAFSAIDPGEYIIQVINPSPAQYDFSPKDAGSDDTIDCDVDANGRTDVLTFVSGEIKQHIDAGLAPEGTNLPQSDNSFAIAEIPDDFALLPNSPNPFNPVTMIHYQLPQESHVKLIIYDISGRQIAKLVDERQGAGLYTVPWQASSSPSGLYFYYLEAGRFKQWRKMTLVK